MAGDLLVTARRLAKANPKRPRQADLRRSVSTAYYAVFHALAHQCADRLVGTGGKRSEPAWQQTYRALEHGFAKDACFKARNLGFPQEIVDFGDAFAQLQEERHKADYDPFIKYSRAEVFLHISHADQAIRSLNSATRRDQQAFAVLVLLKRRS